MFGISVVIFASLFLGSTSAVRACVNWCGQDCIKYSQITGLCTSYLTLCCDERGGTGITCDAGYYACNRNIAGCCPIGDTGGGSGTIDPYCPPGTTVTPDYTVTPQCGLYKFLRNCVIGPVCGRSSQGDKNYCYAYTCVPTCSAPAAPTLASPADLASLASTSVNLLWNSVTFTSGCTGEYKVYVGTANPPTTLLATVDASTLNYNFTGVNGTTYYWYVSASNGGRRKC